MNRDGARKSREHIVHELRHVVLALQATKRMLLRESTEFDVMASLQLQSIERIQELIAFHESHSREGVSVPSGPSARKGI